MPSTSIVRFLAIALFGILCFLSHYTRILGIISFVILLFPFFKRPIYALQARRDFDKNPLFKSGTNYTISQSGLLEESEAGFRVSCTWDNNTICTEDKNWIIISGAGTHPLCFPVAKLKQDGAYDAFTQFVKSHASEYNKKKTLRTA
jgi:hypothetical protein